MSVVARLFCLDTVMIDIVLRIDEVPERGADVLASEHLIATGGGYNAMSSAARQGVSAVYAGRLGRGPFSDIARGSLERDKIANPFERDETHDAGFCVALIDDTGERTFVTSPGAEGSLRSSDLSTLDVSEGDFVLISGYNVMYPDSATIVLEWLAKLGDDVVVAFDPSNRVTDIPEENLRWILDRADWILCNEIEARLLTGVVSLVGSVVALGQRTGRRGVVVRHGASGCTILIRNTEPVHVPGFVATVVDTNGAGDTHSGVFLAELARGTEPIEAALRGNAAAAVAISVLGPASGPERSVVSEMILGSP
ncbi:MAG TPA: PfkB family carbohydrate kinase [Acidimicrobiales bacterium]|nr:PfkB family carbohydrate kinase [Acidimicrobiales bacterium]